MFFEGIRATFFPKASITEKVDKPEEVGIESLEQIEAELEACNFEITPRVFAHRLVPAYLEKTKIVGTHSKLSADHWIRLIKLWLEGKGLFAQQPIATKHLKHLLSVLEDYKSQLEETNTLERDVQEILQLEKEARSQVEKEYHLSKPLPEDSPSTVVLCQEAAQKKLKQIQAKLSQQNVVYVPLGYQGGVHSGGHAIVFKLINRSKNVEGLFLNLGEGAQMHPQVDWSSAGPSFHFQSFPVIIEKSVLASERCEDVFTRLNLLLVDFNLSAQTNDYSAEDVYGPIYSLGTIQSGFSSTIATRASKPQLGDICADMAIVLLIKDVLIDLGYQKEQLHQLFTLEKICDVLFFYHQLKQSKGSCDQWTLLKNGFKELTIRNLKNDDSDGSDIKLKKLHSIFPSLFAYTLDQIKRLKITPVSIDCLVADHTNSNSAFAINIENIQSEGLDFKLPASCLINRTYLTPAIDPLAPDKVVETLENWASIAYELKEAGKFNKVNQFVYRALLSLEIPHATQKGFWDQVPIEQIAQISQLLIELNRLGCHTGTKPTARFNTTHENYIPSHLSYRNTLMLSIGYVITDYLVRRKHPEQFEGFASPFLCSQFRLSNNSYMGWEVATLQKKEDEHSHTFRFLPQSAANQWWAAISDYFEYQQARSRYTLFAIGTTHLDIEEGVRDSQHSKIYRSWTAVEQHLKFLEQFLEKSFPKGCGLSLLSQYLLLWLNENNQYLPSEIENLYFFAYYSDLAPRQPLRAGRVPRAIYGGAIRLEQQLTGCTYEATFLGNAVPQYCELFTQRNLSQNQIECLQTWQSNKLRKTDSWELDRIKEWARIFSNPSLQISSLLPWMRQNVSYLSEKKIHPYIEIALFQPGLLGKEVREEPDILDQLRDFIAGALQYHTQALFNPECMFFLLRLGIAIETYAPSPSLEILQGYENVLIKTLNSHNYPATSMQHLLFLYQVALPRKQDSFRELIKAHFWLNHHPKSEGSSPLWLTNEITMPFEKYQAIALACLKDNEWVEKTFYEVFSMLLDKETVPKEPSSATYPMISKGKYRMDLEEAKLYCEQSQLICLEGDLCKEFSSTLNERVWINLDGLLSTSGLNKIDCSIKGCAILKRQFPLLEEPLSKSWFSKVTIEPARQKNDPLFFNAKGYTFWQATDQTECDTIIICKKNHCQPLYLVSIDPKTSNCKISQIRSNGQKGLTLLNLHDDTTPLASWLQRLGAQEEALVWVDEKSGKIEEIELLALELSFKRHEERFYCNQHPTYFLSDEQTIEPLNGFTGSIVIENGEQKKILLPMRSLLQKRGDFSTVVTFDKRTLFDASPFTSKPHNAKTCLFFFDEMTGVLTHPEPSGNFLLVLLFAMQREYEQALFYLSRTRSFELYKLDYEWAIHPIQSLTDHSPEALIFYLRFGLHLIRQSHQIISEIADPKCGWGYPYRLGSSFIATWMAEKYKYYLRIHSLQEIGRVPEALQLSREEELFLLRFLKKEFDQEEREVKKKSGVLATVLISYMKPFWDPSFDTRLSLLLYNKWSTQIVPAAYPLCLRKMFYHINDINLDILCSRRPKLKDSGIPLEPFVRLPHMEDHFIQLYDKARTGDFEIDLFYLSQTYKATERSALAYFLLLRYVKEYPQKFAHLEFRQNDPVHNIEVFDQIVAMANSILAKLKQGANAVNDILLNQTTYFKYAKLITLSAKPPPSFQPQLWEISDQKAKTLHDLQTSLFNHFYDHWFDSSKKALLAPNTPFALATISPTTSAMQKWHIQLYVGYQQLLSGKMGKPLYTLKQEKQRNPTLCLASAQKLLEQKRYEQLETKQKAEKIANSYPDTAYRVGLRKMCGNLPQITMEGILKRAYQKQDPLLIKQANPSLTPQQIEQLIFYTIKYHILTIHIDQLEKGIEHLKKDSLQGFAEAIEWHRAFNSLENPEIFLYQSIAKKTFRKQQADLLAWEVATTQKKRRLFSIPAGEGKTTLYIPIAMQRLHRLGLVPCSISSKPLYCVDREGLKESSQTIFSSELNVFELALNAQLRPSDYRQIYKQLLERSERGGFKLTPESFYALHLKYQLALENSEIESVKWLSHILAFLEMKGAALIDESRQNCSPLTQAKIGIGKSIPLPSVDRKAFLEIYRLMLDDTLLLPDKRKLKEVVSLQENNQATMTQKERLQVKATLIKALVKQPYFKIAPEQQSAIIHYWLGKIEKPTWVQEKTNQGRTVELVKIYFEDFFENAMQLVWRMHHVASIQPTEEIHVPAKARQATRAYFEEVYITLIATIHGMLQEGLQKKQIQTLLLELELKQKKLSGNLCGETYLERWLSPEQLSRFAGIPFRELFLSKTFNRIIYKNKEAIFWYLEHVVLKQIRISPEQLYVTPIHLLNGYKQTTLFSADPGPKEIYEIFKDEGNIHENPLFVIHALQQFVKKENQKFLTFPSPQSPLDFFTDLLTKDPELFSHLRMICDAGGTLRNFTAEELVHGFFAFLEKRKEIDYDGLIIFEEASHQESETDLLLWLKGWSQPKVLKGHDVPRSIEQLGLQWEKLKLLTIIDPSHRVGANIEQPKDTSILVLLGEDLTFSDALQGTLRGRGVLKGDEWVIWGAEERLAQTISNAISIEKATAWEMDNGMRFQDQEILLSIQQQIDYHIAFQAWEQIKAALKNPQKQIDLWHQYRKGFVRPTEVDPLKRTKEKQALSFSPQSMLNYAQKQYALFNYSTAWSKVTLVHQKLKPLFEIAKGKDPICASLFDTRRHSYIYTYQKEEIKEQKITDTHIDLVPEEFQALPDSLTIDRQDFVSALSYYSYSACALFQSTGLTKGLWFTKNGIYTARTGNIALREDYLKSLQYLLVVCDKGKWSAFALADGEGEFFKKQFAQFLTLPFKCALLSGDGKLVRNGKGTSGFSKQELESTFIQDVVIDVNLAHCQLFYPIRFIERIKSWSDFWPLWTHLKSAQPQSDATSIKQIERLVPNEIQNYQPPKSDPGFNSLNNLFFS